MVKQNKTKKEIPVEFLMRSPEEEYEVYVQQQLETARRFGETQKVKVYEDALEFGLKILKEII